MEGDVGVRKVGLMKGEWENLGRVRDRGYVLVEVWFVVIEQLCRADESFLVWFVVDRIEDQRLFVLGF